jgi:hypothetical protein
MIWKILVVLVFIWLFFKLFGNKILLYLLKKIVKNLEQKTLKDLKYFENMYDEKARNVYPLNEDFSIIIPENHYSAKGKKRIIEEVEFEEVILDKEKNERNFTD